MQVHEREKMQSKEEKNQIITVRAFSSVFPIVHVISPCPADRRHGRCTQTRNIYMKLKKSKKPTTKNGLEHSH